MPLQLLSIELIVCKVSVEPMQAGLAGSGPAEAAAVDMFCEAHRKEQINKEI